MKAGKQFKAAFFAILALGFALNAGAKPNIVVIVSDDQGYADVSYNKHHPPEVSTPNIDSLAKSGVILTSGYTSGHVCSPTRAGLMTGRYQQRFGIYTAGAGGSGVPLDETLFAEYMKEGGYKSGVFGKWHLGLEPEFNPTNRGFDYFYGFMGRGAHDYFDLSVQNEKMGSSIYRNLDPINDEGYLTTRITEEAVSFIQRQKDEPFFAYICFNAVHSPAQAPEEDIALFDTGDETRNILMAMLKHLDAGVGEIVKALKDAGVYENTLIFYLSDNGGSGVMNANNAPLRGFKQQDYEGGIHVPFLASWPGQLKAGTTCDVPAISFDILPTALAAAGIPVPEDAELDGKNMLPALKGETNKLHDFLCWNSGDGKWAIQKDGWKIVAVKETIELFNLEADLAETTDLAEKNPEKMKELTKIYEAWLDEMAEPLGGAFKRWDPENAKKLAAEQKAKSARKAGKDKEEAAARKPAHGDETPEEKAARRDRERAERSIERQKK